MQRGSWVVWTLALFSLASRRLVWEDLERSTRMSRKALKQVKDRDQLGSDLFYMAIYENSHSVENLN